MSAFCSGKHLANRAADGRDYPNHGASPFDRVATRDEGTDDNGEPLCSDVAGDTWAKFPVLNRVETVIRLPRHHIDTEGA